VSELAELYAVFALIYAFECAEVVPRRAVGLVALWGRWRLRRPFIPNAGWARGLLFAEPWPPLAPALVTEPLPLVAGPDGLAWTGGGAGSDESGARFLPWTEVERVAAAGASLVVNGESVAVLATRRGAAALAEVLAGLGRLPRAEREVRLERWLDARFDSRAVLVRLPVLRRETLPLRIAANVLWAGLFLGLPALLFTPVVYFFLPAGAVTVIAWIGAAVLFRRALRRSSWLTPALRPDLAKRVVAVTSPMATMRAADHIARELAGDLDPLAVAAALLPARRLRTAGRAWLCDLRYRSAGDPATGGEGDARWWRAQMLARVERTLRAHDIDPDALISPPARDDAEAVAWCPSCLAQYRQGGAGRGAGADAAEPPVACANETCRGITLRPFAG
jgi:hypothetical protein